VSRKRKGKRKSKAKSRRRPLHPNADYRRAVRKADSVLAESGVEIQADTWQAEALDWFTADDRDRQELARYIAAHEGVLGIPWARDLLRLEVFLRAADHEAILAHYDRAMNRYPRCPLVEMWAAEALARHGADWWRARAMLLYAVEQLTDQARPRYELGFQHYLLGDFAGAIGWFDEAAERLTETEDDIGSRVYYNRGLVRHALTGDKKAAVADVKTALRLDPDYAQAKQTLRALRGRVVRWVPW
jgi:tetratricopeptide (TPR) repeat protein